MKQENTFNFFERKFLFRDRDMYSIDYVHVITGYKLKTKIYSK